MFLLQKGKSALKIFFIWLIFLFFLLTLLVVALLLFLKLAPNLWNNLKRPLQNCFCDERNRLQSNERRNNRPQYEQSDTTENNENLPEESNLDRADDTNSSTKVGSINQRQNTYASNKETEGNVRGNMKFNSTINSDILSIVELYRKNKSQNEIEEFLYGKNTTKFRDKESTNQLSRIEEETTSLMNTSPTYIESSAGGWLKIQERRELPPSTAWNNKSFFKKSTIKNSSELTDKSEYSNKNSKQNKHFLRTLRL